MTDSIRKGWTSASNATADRLCPGRHRAQLGIPEEKSKDADFGNAIHAALASGDPAALDSQQREIFDACQKIEAELVKVYFGGEKPAITLREKRFWWKREEAGVTVVGHSGQVDVIHRLKEKALLLDFKTLAADVPESPENEQLRDLVVLSAGHLLVQEVAVAIVAPLVTHSPEPCVYEKQDIAQATPLMIERVEASNKPDAPRVAGPVQCAFCRAKTSCESYTAWAGSKVPVPAGLTSMAIVDWTPEQRAIFCENRSIAQTWLDGAWEFMEKGMVKDPNFVPGWHLKPNSPQKPINDLQAMFARVAALKPDADILPDFMKCLDGNKTDIKELIGKLTGLKGKALADKANELFEGITTEIPKKASLKKKE